MRDTERVRRIQRALELYKLDALLVTNPVHVRLLTGYWPVVGNAVAAARQDGRMIVIAPKDERQFAERGWANEILEFEPGSLHDLRTPEEVLRGPLEHLAEKFGMQRGGLLGFEDEPLIQPVTYAANFSWGAAVLELLHTAMPADRLRGAGKMLARLRSVLTPSELEPVRMACRLAEQAFNTVRESLIVGMRENAVAALMQTPLSACSGTAGIARAGGFSFCMSGPNSSESFAAYQYTRSRQLELGDLALVHTNSYVDGLWTDITRTFCLGQPDAQKARIYRAVFEASEAALAAIKPGTLGCDVDNAARRVMTEHGFGEQFVHATGHGVGFAAINHNALPCLHPKSQDVLESGMVFNVEPAAYFRGLGGIRQCSMVAVTETGAELLTPFQSKLEDLVIAGR